MKTTSRVPKNRFSQEQRLEVLKLYQQSGLSVRSFAPKHGVGVSTLHQWLRRYQGPGHLAATKKPVAFQAVELLSSFSPNWAAEVALASGVTVRLSAQAPQPWVAELLHSLRSAC